MPNSHEYLMPDYYPNFKCKMGACRTSCCEGWPVSISDEDYFKLVGMNCDSDIRRRIDCALHIKDGATTDEYAEISHDYEGNCKLHLPDGRCAIQAGLGEDALPLVCKLYPRAYRFEGDRECSCTGSCERVVEMLLHHPEPLRFVKKHPEFTVPNENKKSDYAENIDGEQELRLFFIKLVQDRNYPLPTRIYRMGFAMEAVGDYLNRGETPDLVKTLENISHIDGAYDFGLVASNLPLGLEIIEKMMHAMDRHGTTLNQYGEQILEYFGKSANPLETYLLSKKKFEKMFPEWESGFENLIVNHMFFSRFPYADENESMFDEYLAICMVYASMRFLSIGWMATHETEEVWVDILAAAFRLFEHTPFHQYAASVIHRYKYDNPDDIFILIHL